MPSKNGRTPDLLELRFLRIEVDEKTGDPRQYRNKIKPLDLVGTAEAAELLGVERPRIGRWLSKGEMPMPVVWLAAGPVWYRKSIQAMVDEVESRRRPTHA